MVLGVSSLRVVVERAVTSLTARESGSWSGTPRPPRTWPPVTLCPAQRPLRSARDGKFPH